jgi:plastocyanin
LISLDDDSVLQRQIIHSAAVGLTFGLAVLLLECALPAEDSRTTPGVISGTVTYQPDSERPWRYARYYVADRRTGALAEAVVALSSRSLRDLNPPDEPAIREMDQKDFRFDPETMVLRAGDSVRFTNSDPTVHNVRTSDGNRPFNVNIGTGAEHVQEFDRAGGLRRPIRIGCVLHSTMRAWIYVFDHPFYALTEQTGAFRFEGVPPGEYTLQLTHPAGELAWSQDVTIEPGSDIHVDIELSPDNLTSEKEN